MNNLKLKLEGNAIKCENEDLSPTVLWQKLKPTMTYLYAFELYIPASDPSNLRLRSRRNGNMSNNELAEAFEQIKSVYARISNQKGPNQKQATHQSTTNLTKKFNTPEIEKPSTPQGSLSTPFFPRGFNTPEFQLPPSTPQGNLSTPFFPRGFNTPEFQLPPSTPQGNLSTPPLTMWLNRSEIEKPSTPFFPRGFNTPEFQLPPSTPQGNLSTPQTNLVTPRLPPDPIDLVTPPTPEIQPEPISSEESPGNRPVHSNSTEIIDWLSEPFEALPTEEEEHIEINLSQTPNISGQNDEYREFSATPNENEGRDEPTQIALGVESNAQEKSPGLHFSIDLTGKITGTRYFASNSLPVTVAPKTIYHNLRPAIAEIQAEEPNFPFKLRLPTQRNVASAAMFEVVTATPILLSEGFQRVVNQFNEMETKKKSISESRKKQKRKSKRQQQELNEPDETTTQSTETDTRAAKRPNTSELEPNFLNEPNEVNEPNESIAIAPQAITPSFGLTPGQYFDLGMFSTTDHSTVDSTPDRYEFMLNDDNQIVARPELPAETLKALFKQSLNELKSADKDHPILFIEIDENKVYLMSPSRKVTQAHLQQSFAMLRSLVLSHKSDLELIWEQNKLPFPR